jgi:endonuclease YncB( thermonuclease family)
VFQGDVNVNQVLVKEGWCWWVSKYVLRDAVLQKFEEVKEAKKGLWADPNPTPPWLYRRLDAGGLSLASATPRVFPNFSLDSFIIKVELIKRF